MNGSLRIAKFAGIGVYVHWSFLLLIGWVAYQHLSQGEGGVAALRGILFTLAIFGCVVLHEYGHALAARRYGIRTRDITLLPIGGVARLERIPTDPWQEFVVAVAGPAVNVVIAALLLPIVLLTMVSIDPTQLDPLHGNFALQLMLVNVMLIVFNLIPAFPMDGGRMLRAGLAALLPHSQATRVAANIGQGVAILLGLLGIVTQQWTLLLIAAFVIFGARGEVQASEARATLGGLFVRDAMATDYVTFPPQEPIDRLLFQASRGLQRDFPIVLAGEVIGMVYSHDLRRAAVSQEMLRTSTAGELMSDQVPIVSDDLPLEAAVDKMQQSGSSAVLVAHGSRLVGLLTHSLLGAYLEFRRTHPAGQSTRGFDRSI